MLAFVARAFDIILHILPNTICHLALLSILASHQVQGLSLILSRVLDNSVFYVHILGIYRRKQVSLSYCAMDYDVCGRAS